MKRAVVLTSVVAWFFGGLASSSVLAADWVASDWFDCDCQFGVDDVFGRLGTGRQHLTGAERRKLADKHAPAGLMGDHVHHPGELMLEYKYMNMYMDDNRTGTRTVSDTQALAIGQSLGTNFGATPTQMTMEVHMIHIMYGWTENVTVYAMPRFTSLTMDHIRGPVNPAVQGGLVPVGSPFTTHNSGWTAFSWNRTGGSPPVGRVPSDLRCRHPVVG